MINESSEFKDFQKGRWVEFEPTSEMISDGTLPIQAKSLNGSAVISVIEWVEKAEAGRDK